MPPLVAARGAGAGPAGGGPAAAAAGVMAAAPVAAGVADAAAGAFAAVETLADAAAPVDVPEAPVLDFPVVCAEAVASTSSGITSATTSVLAHRIIDPF